MNEYIQAIEVYRGVDIHDCQPRDRIEGVVKPEIDAVFEMLDIRELVAYAQDEYRSPESRLFAEAKVRAMHEMSAAERTARPNVDLQWLAAVTAGLDSRDWRSPSHYGTILARGRAPGEAELPARPPEYGKMVEEDDKRLHEEERAEARRAGLPVYGE